VSESRRDGAAPTGRESGTNPFVRPPI
jgi:hypothetical protein